MQLSQMDNSSSLILSETTKSSNFSNDSICESFEDNSESDNKKYGKFMFNKKFNSQKQFFNVFHKGEIEEKSIKSRKKQHEQLVWTQKEEKTLFSLGNKKIKKRWDFIASLLKTKTASQCYYHFNSRNPDIKRKNWSDEEDRKILNLFKIHGRKWEEIARRLKNRTGKQVRDRYLNHLDNSVNHSKFSEKEDKQILELYLKHGASWAKISNELGNRSSDVIKSRFYSSIKKKFMDNDIAKEYNIDNLACSNDVCENLDCNKCNIDIVDTKNEDKFEKEISIDYKISNNNTIEKGEEELNYLENDFDLIKKETEMNLTFDYDLITAEIDHSKNLSENYYGSKNICIEDYVLLENNNIPTHCFPSFQHNLIQNKNFEKVI